MKFRPYQIKATEFILRRPYAGLFAEMSMGKTAITLFALEQLKMFGEFQPTLLLAPALVLESTWPDEIKKWDFDLSYVILKGGKPSERKKILQQSVDLYLMSYDMLPWLFKQPEYKKLKFLVCDEITKLKSTKSMRFRTIKKHLMRFSRRIGLTGMPISNHLIDVFGIMYVIDSGMTFSKKGEFISKYFYNVSKNDYPIYKPFPGAEEKIHRQIARNATVLKADDYLDLPPFVYQDRRYVMPPKVKKIYNQVDRDYFSVISNKDITVKTAAVKSQKLRQVSSGFIYDEEETLFIHDVKLKGVRDYVDELAGSPTLIAYYYEESLKRLKSTFKGAPVINKETKNITQIVENWNQGKHEVLIIHPSKSHGLNLQFGGSHVYWYELTWVYDDYAQLNMRLRRPGQKDKRVFIHHGIFEDTIDRLMLISLNLKFEQQDRLFEAVKLFQKLKRRENYENSRRRS